MKKKLPKEKKTSDFRLVGVLAGALILAVIFITAIILTTPAESGTAGLENEIRIGAIYNLNGSQSSLDIPSARGAQIAVDAINENGGVDGKTVRLVLYDGRTNTSDIRAAASRLVQEDDVVAIIGMSDTDMVIPAAETAAGSGTVFVTSGATSPLLPEKVPGYLYLACFGDNAQAAAAAEFARSDLNATTAFVVTDRSMEYTRLLSRYFEERFTGAGGTVTGTMNYSGTTWDNGTFFAGSGISGSSPDVVFVACGPENCGNVTHAIRAAGISAPVLGGDSFDFPGLAADAGADAGRIFYTTHADISTSSGDPNMTDFISRYTKKYNEKPNAFAALGYDTVNVVVKAARFSPSSTDLREGLWSISGYDGLTGTISYANRSYVPQKSVTILELRNGIVVSHGERILQEVAAP